MGSNDLKCTLQHSYIHNVHSVYQGSSSKDRQACFNSIHIQYMKKYSHKLKIDIFAKERYRICLTLSVHHTSYSDLYMTKPHKCINTIFICMLYTPTGDVGSLSMAAFTHTITWSANTPAWSGIWYLAWSSGVETSIKVFLILIVPSSPSTSFLWIMALALQPWLALSEQEYHQVFRSREVLFFVNLNIMGN